MDLVKVKLHIVGVTSRLSLIRHIVNQIVMIFGYKILFHGESVMKIGKGQNYGATIVLLVTD